MSYLKICILLCLATNSYVVGKQNNNNLQQPISLQTAVKDIPSIGLGLWNSKASSATNATKYALDVGYTHLDSAAAYSNEEYVGKALNDSKRPRSSYWITSKLWNDHHRPDLVRPALEKTLSDLNTSYLDLYLMHWPISFKASSSTLDKNTSIVDTWHAMESLVHANLTRHIGISNFSPAEIKHLLNHSNIKPYAHEYETHPYLQQSEFTLWHLKHDIKVIAYSPLANLNPTYAEAHPDLPLIIQDPFWIDMAWRKNCTAAQAILAWGVQRGTIVIPKSVHEARIVENLNSLKVKFSDMEMAEISVRDKKARLNDPSKGWGVNLFQGLDDGH